MPENLTVVSQSGSGDRKNAKQIVKVRWSLSGRTKLLPRPNQFGLPFLGGQKAVLLRLMMIYARRSVIKIYAPHSLAKYIYLYPKPQNMHIVAYLSL